MEQIDIVLEESEAIKRLSDVCDEWEDGSHYVEVKIEVVGLPELGERDTDNYMDIEHYFATYPDKILRVRVYANDIVVDIFEV